MLSVPGTPLHPGVVRLLLVTTGLGKHAFVEHGSLHFCIGKKEGLGDNDMRACLGQLACLKQVTGYKLCLLYLGVAY